MTIHSASQRGDIASIIHLLDTHQATVNDKDQDGCSPLHWAAINAHSPTCNLLLDRGAEIDSKGGELVATPLHWAARSGHLYVIINLLNRGADPTLIDSQGFNALHLITHSSNVMALLYVLQHSKINTSSSSLQDSSSSSIDFKDSQGHTSLMWAAYQGDSLSIELLLSHGSNPNLKDNDGLSPLHWAVVKGNRQCIRKLLESNSDIWLRNNQGKTPREMSRELKSENSYLKGLADSGRELDGRKRQKWLGEVSSHSLDGKKEMIKKVQVGVNLGKKEFNGSILSSLSFPFQKLYSLELTLISTFFSISISPETNTNHNPTFTNFFPLFNLHYFFFITLVHSFAFGFCNLFRNASYCHQSPFRWKHG